MYSYVGFFVIIWASWFHTTLYDVRFAHDSIYERLCKVVQMVSFVGFALVGTAFDPGSTKANIGVRLSSCRVGVSTAWCALPC